MSGLFRFPRNFVKHDRFQVENRAVTINALYDLKSAAGSKDRSAPLRDDHIILAVIDGLFYMHASFKRWRNRRRTLRALAELDERQLRDIGLTRDDPIFDSSFRWPSYHEDRGRHKMKWITREYVKVDRVACPWLIKKFVDKNAEFLFVPADKVMEEAKRQDAIPYDVKNVELGHHGKECSFEAILKKYRLTDNPALVLLGQIVNGADTDNTLYNQPEGPGLVAVAEGFRHLGYKNDHELNAAEWIVYDALYAYCQQMVKAGKPNGQFA
jgi:uncharacterized protein YjeT (DUF2065 family)